MEATQQENSDDPLEVLLRRSAEFAAVAKPTSKIQPAFAGCLPELLK